MTRLSLILACVVLLVSGCRQPNPEDSKVDFSSRAIRVVATTNIVADLVSRVGEGRLEVHSLMGPGVDPHLFKASAGDVTRMAEADVVVYNGLHLEGKMTEVFEQMRGRGIPTLAVAEDTALQSSLRESELFQGNFDPHVWFDVTLWMRVARATERYFATLDPVHADTYAANTAAYVVELEAAHRYVLEQAESVPEALRVLVTSHDAFGYFGLAYGFEVRGLQGISTATEAGTADVQDVAAMVASRRIPAMFIESSVSPRGIEAVREAVRARGFEVAIGGTLYGDALGGPASDAATYLSMVRHNVDTIVDALLETRGDAAGD